MNKVLYNFQDLGKVVEPFDANYLTNKPYEVPQLSAYEKRFIHKVSVLEKTLKRNKVFFDWVSEWQCFRVHKFVLGSEYPSYRYVWVDADENEYLFGTENEALVYDGKASVVVNAVVKWLNSKLVKK